MTVQFFLVIVQISTNLPSLLVSVLACRLLEAENFALYFSYYEPLIPNYNDDYEEENLFWLCSTCCTPLPLDHPPHELCFIFHPSLS